MIHFLMQLAKGKPHIGPSSKCDLSKYLDTVYYSYISHNKIKNFNIMNWWKSHESTFPMLSKMTCDVLTPSMSTVASEYAFSISMNMIGDIGKTFAIEILEALTCLKDCEDRRMKLLTLEYELKEDLEKLDFNTNNDAQEIDND